MRTSFSATTEATPGDLFDVVSDLETYPHWLDVVSDVEPTGDPDAWLVTLKARVGPFSRSKRLRMARATQHRSTDGEPSTVRFERREVDGKNHSVWVMAAEVGPWVADRADTGDRRSGPGKTSEVELELIYDGSLWSGLLDGVLKAAADRAAQKLQAYVRP